jgi:hypothetical protein
MLNQTERNQYISQIEKLPEAAETAVAGLSDEQLDTPYRESSWTIRQVIHHLADSHMNGYVRMRLALTEQKPVLKSYEQDQWAALADYSLPLESSLKILRGVHQRWTVFLRSISQEDWSRTGVHTEAGEVTLDDLLVDYARHGPNHLAPIHTLRKANGW